MIAQGTGGVGAAGESESFAMLHFFLAKTEKRIGKTNKQQVNLYQN